MQKEKRKENVSVKLVPTREGGEQVRSTGLSNPWMWEHFLPVGTGLLVSFETMESASQQGYQPVGNFMSKQKMGRSIYRDLSGLSPHPSPCNGLMTTKHLSNNFGFCWWSVYKYLHDNHTQHWEREGGSVSQAGSNVAGAQERLWKWGPKGRDRQQSTARRKFCICNSTLSTLQASSTAPQPHSPSLASTHGCATTTRSVIYEILYMPVTVQSTFMYYRVWYLITPYRVSINIIPILEIRKV